MFGSSDIQPTGIAIRDYQLNAVTAIRKKQEAGYKSTLCVMPTGTGKTVTFGYYIRRAVQDHGIRALVLAHRGELIQQASDKLVELGLNVGVEKADSRGRAFGEPHAVVATVQTLQGKRLQTWPSDYFGLIVTDEAHHATADSYGAVYKHFRKAFHLGVTATADRGDKVDLGCVFESVAYEMTLLDAMTAPAPGPYLSRLEVVQCELGIDLKDIRTTAGDLNSADIEEAIKPYIEAIANAIKDKVGGRSTIVFTPDVGSSMAIATALQSIDVAATWISGDDSDRAEKLRKYKSGEIQVLCNCALLTEGFDAPRTSAIVLCRPTKSRALYAQMVGRGTRLFPGKDACLIVDFDWICGRHQLVKPVELMVGNMTSDEDDGQAIGKTAQDMLDSGQCVDLMDAIEKAKKQEEEKNKRRLLNLEVNRKNLQYKTVRYDPLAGYHAIGLPTQFGKEWQPKPATEKQINALRKLGVAVSDDISFSKAGKMISVLKARIDAGLSSLKQVNWMIANGVEPAQARAMTFKEASAYLDSIWGKRLF
jgi:superfamily II DNA or RNA helicase